MGADLLIAVKQGLDLYQVSDNEEVLLVDVPASVAQKAELAGISLREYVHNALQSFSTPGDEIRTALMKLLEGNDSVAFGVRERLGTRFFQEIVA